MYIYVCDLPRGLQAAEEPQGALPYIPADPADLHQPLP